MYFLDWLSFQPQQIHKLCVNATLAAHVCSLGASISGKSGFIKKKRAHCVALTTYCWLISHNLLKWSTTSQCVILYRLRNISAVEVKGHCGGTLIGRFYWLCLCSVLVIALQSLTYGPVASVSSYTLISAGKRTHWCRPATRSLYHGSTVTKWHVLSAPFLPFLGTGFSSCSLISCDLPNYCN